MCLTKRAVQTMTDNEKIKALEDFVKQQSDGYQTYLEHGGKSDECQEKFLEVVESFVEMFNRQKAEIEALIAGQETLQKYIAEQKAEIERLEKGSLKEAMIFNSKTIANVKAEAYKEFAERLKEDICSFGKHITVEDVDNLVKEMAGDAE